MREKGWAISFCAVTAAVGAAVLVSSSVRALPLKGIPGSMPLFTKQPLHKKRGTYAEGAIDAIIFHVRSGLLVKRITIGPVGTACNPRGGQKLSTRSAAARAVCASLPGSYRGSRIAQPQALFPPGMVWG
jgi:hypothetical protein